MAVMNTIDSVNAFPPRQPGEYSLVPRGNKNMAVSAGLFKKK
jgi:hypothetical protein